MNVRTRSSGAVQKTAAPLLPPNFTIEELRKRAAGCTACDLWKSGTQTVFGEGPKTAEVVLVGEQPGDKEDKLSHPFVMATVHPSTILRAPDKETRHQEKWAFTEDLKKAAEIINR